MERDIVNSESASPAWASILLFLAIFDGIALVAFGGMSTSSHCVVLGPWSIEPSLGLSIAAVLAVGLPLLAMGLLRLHMPQGETTGVILDALMAVFTPGLVMMALEQLVRLPGSTVLKWLLAGALLLALGVAILLLWGQVTGGFGYGLASEKAVRAGYFSWGCLCLAFVLVMQPLKAVGPCECGIGGEPLPDGVSAEEILSDRALWSGDAWESLDYRGKLEKLAVVVSAECARLNIADAPAIEVYSLREGLAGAYDDKRNVIEIDAGVLDSEYSVAFEDVCHECAHAFQRACLDDTNVVQGSAWPWSVDERALGRWEYEDVNYVSGKEDFGAYLVQDSELSARAWATHELREFGPGGAG